jgi:predicted DsbA family dithiol-disulfide isomerase
VSLKPLQDRGVQLVWKAWKMPAGAEPPAKPEGYKEEVGPFLSDLLSKYDLEIKPPSAHRNTFLAHVGGKFAIENNLHEKYHIRIFEAIWKLDENIEEVETLLTIAEEVGLDRLQFTQALQDNKYSQKVQEDFDLATELKIWTIPSYVGNKGTIQIHHFRDLPSIEELMNLI